MPLVVSDTSPIRALNHLGLVDALGELFDRVLVPPTVFNELAHPRPRFVAIDLSQFAFVEVRAPQNSAQVQQFRAILDVAESEALALALEVGAEALLIDEAEGRSLATLQRMPVIGTLAILSRVKQAGQIAEIGPLLDELRNELDFFVSDKLRDAFLKSVGE